MATHAVSDGNLGAWLLRCNPDVWDLPSFIEDGNDSIGSWTVVRNYRSEMMDEGQRVLLWATGDGKRIARGIWGLGYVTGPTSDRVLDKLDLEDFEPEGAEADDSYEDDIDYWLDQAARDGAENAVPVEIVLLAEAITDVDLRAAGIDDLEVQRQPQGSNPSWISKEQLRRLEAFLPRWPHPSEPVAEVTVSARGAGFGSPLQNEIVERAAMTAVREKYEDDGRTVQDVSSGKHGWDLTCRKGEDEAKVEVKGVSGDKPSILLTRNEVRAAEEDKGWVLAVVTRAVSAPAVRTFTATEVCDAARPYLYKANLGSAG